MKKLAIYLSVFLLLVLGVFILLSANVNSLFATLKPQLEARASEALGTPVTLQTVSASVFPSVKLTVEGIGVGETKRDALSLKQVHIALNILPLLRKEISIGEIVLVEPVLTLVKGTEGTRVSGISKRKPPSEPKQGSPEEPTSPPASYNLDSITIKDGTVSYRDDVEGRSVVINNLQGTASLKVEGERYTITSARAEAAVEKIGGMTFSSEAFEFDAGKGTAKGKVRGNIEGGDIDAEIDLAHRFNEGKIRLISSSLDLSPLFPLIKGAKGSEPLQRLEGSVTGDLTVELIPHRARPRVVGEVTVAGGTVHWEDIRVRDLKTKAVFTAATEREEVLFHPLEAQVTMTKLSQQEVALEAPNTSLELRTLRLSVPNGTARVEKDEAKFTSEVEIPQGRGSYSVTSPHLTSPTLATFVPAFNAVQGIISPTVKGSFGPKGEWSIRGDIGISEGEIAFAEHKVSELGGALLVNGGGKGVSFESDNLALKLNDTPLSLRVDGVYAQDVVKIGSLNASLLGGTGELKGGMHTVLNDFNLSASLQELQLGGLLSMLQLVESKKVKGTITEFSARIKGEIGTMLKTSLTGPTALEVKESELQGVNVAREVLKKIESVPLLEGELLSRIPGEFQPILAADATHIESLETQLFFEGGKARIERLKVESDLFSLDGIGETSLLDGFLRLEATLRFSRPFSEALAAKVKEARKVLDAEGTLAVPVAITGVPPKVSVVPDIKKLVEMGARKVFEERASDLLEQALGGKRQEGEKPRLKELFDSLRGR